MEKDRDVPGGDPQFFRDVVAGLLFEHSQRDDGSLDLAELFDAFMQPDALFRARDEVIGGRVFRRQRVIVEAVVRLRTEMPAPAVPRCIADHRRQ